MAFLKNKIALLIVALALPACAMADDLDLNVIYPKPDQRLRAVDSTFVFGSVRPGSSLKINNVDVDVHRDGGWLAFLPVRPGQFEFNIQASNKELQDSTSIIVFFPELPQNRCDSLYITPSSLSPRSTVWVKPGDRVELSFSGTPYCNSFAIIENSNDTIVMTESLPHNYYSGRTVFDSVSGAVITPDSLLIKGRYRGSLLVPETEDDSLVITFGLYPLSLAQLTWIQLYSSDKAIPLATLAGLPRDILTVNLPVTIKLLHETDRMVYKLKDSLTTIRTGPGKGYLCVQQPAGIRAELIGKSGKWLKLKLAPNQVGWVPDTSGIILPAGSDVPHSYVSLVRTKSFADKTTVSVSTSAVHPFRIVENIREHSITIYLYGVDADTDWIRYDNNDPVIDHIVWFQDEPSVFGLKIYLTEDRIWGYDGYYVGGQFRFDIKRMPDNKSDISDFRFIIDPGHSPDLGAVGPTGLTEAEANLGIALELAKRFRNNGADVVMTRDDDSPLPLYDRPKIAVRAKGDIFISIHNNALPDGTNPFVNNGISVFYYHPHSADLANFVHDAMTRNIDLKDHGWFYGNFAVNRPTQYPAILVECAFMMIPQQEAMLRTNKFRKKIADSIIEGIKDFLRGRNETEWDRILDESYNR